ncbi:WD40-repeat-containing domain protein [Cokeromyces recurvatus]|uniref:WD40-repeat-containing domain protein n=1 Tax=Cokeromyces recurvatus TaxID=90255 RepID=UPI0022211E9C|nr:WD40-repeat-containing domain protein [Cokeromyces recurvatus]KAI7899888.1 WD40-repeat-containing domain protein [Cokeromyces recurvatus]
MTNISFFSTSSGYKGHIFKEEQNMIPTYITISPRKDGVTAKTKCLNPQTSKLTPLKRKIKASSSNISSILPKLRVHSSSYHCHFSSSFRSYSSCHTRKRQKEPMSLSNLPYEILFRILFYLDYISVQKLSRTCRSLYSICHDNELWRQLLYADFRSVPPPLTTMALVVRKKKNNVMTGLPTNLKLYQNHLKLGRRWLTGKVTTRFLQGHESSIYCLAWIDKNILVSGSRDQSLKVWDVIRGKCLRTIKDVHEGSILCMSVNKENTILLTGSSDATSVIWSLPDLIPQRRLRGHGHNVLDICFVGDYIVSSSRDHTIQVWQKDTGEQVRQLLGHQASVNSIEPIDQHRIVSASGDASLKLWDIETGECLRTIKDNKLGLASVRFNGTYLYTGGLEGKVKVWDIENGECVKTLVGHVNMIRSIDYVEVIFFLYLLAYYIHTFLKHIYVYIYIINMHRIKLLQVVMIVHSKSGMQRQVLAF